MTVFTRQRKEESLKLNDVVVEGPAVTADVLVVCW